MTFLLSHKNGFVVSWRCKEQRLLGFLCLPDKLALMGYWAPGKALRGGLAKGSSGTVNSASQ